MYWAGDWMASQLATDLKGKEASFQVVEMPKDVKQATVIHGLGWVVAEKSPNKAAALALAAYMGSKDAQLTEAKNGTAIPAFNGTQAAWVKAFPHWDMQLFINAANNYATPYPVSKNTAVWQDKEPDYLTPAFAGTVPVPTAAKNLADFMNAALAKEK
jgi:multiple sugar transport system substrate-binding protein